MFHYTSDRLFTHKISFLFTGSSQVCNCSRYRSDDVEYIHSQKAFLCYVSDGQGECTGVIAEVEFLLAEK